ncbi:glycosyltransferase, partial [Falsiroseomonas oryziterrae]|uniref:glycosyltransferase n=1 Tax=Falsiroseomonas oryziterrae TaxID=2911368 RepID=UPI001F18B25C
RPRSVGLFLHGNEARSQGGPSVRVPRLARELRDRGLEAELRSHPAEHAFAGLDVVHAFNVWAPHTALDLLRSARRAGAATVLSPILLDLSRRGFWHDGLLDLFARHAPGAEAEAAIAEFRAAYRKPLAADGPGMEPVPGYHAAVREMGALSDALILLSEREGQRLAAIGVDTSRASVVRNPVDASLFANASPEPFRTYLGLRDFVLCVARIEPRKNQLMLLQALRDTGLPLVLLGHSPDPAYRALVEHHAIPELHIVDRLPPNSPLLASAFAAARVAVLPSWSEGAPLAALEAAAAGAALVLSDESGESEYLGAYARYCDPADPASIRRAVQEAWETRRDAAAIDAQKAFVAESFGFERHAAETEAVYARALESAAGRAATTAAAGLLRLPPADAPERLPIVLDVTTSAHHRGRWTGISRVEAALALALAGNPRADIRFVTWNNKSRAFGEVPLEAIRDGSLGRVLAQLDSGPVAPPALPEGAHLVVAGSAWMQNAVYAESVVGFARAHGLRLVPVIHDIIPTRFPFWFDDGYAPVFQANLDLLLGNADHVVAVSESTRRDVEAHAGSVRQLVLPEVSVLREGDEIHQATPGDVEPPAELVARFGGRPFVLSVGAIHQRKNHKLLYDAWLRLTERMGSRCPHLVIVGGVAWNGHEVARALRGDPRLRDHVTILEEVDDAALAWLYEACLFTVYPSLYEGWGLPVAESLRHGKLCLAADTSSVPEIAPGLVDLLDPLDVMAWVTRIQFYAGSRAAREAAEARIAAGYRARPWSDSAAQLLDILGSAPPAPPRPLMPGGLVDLSDRIAASRVRGPGWFPTERWGCWARSTEAELRFELPPGRDDPLALAVLARALSLPGTAFEVQVLANGVAVARWSFRGGDIRVLHAIIPADIVAQAPVLHVTFSSPALVAVRDVVRNDDARLVGIGIAKALLAPVASLRDAAEPFAGAQQRARLLPGRPVHLPRDAALAKTLLVGSWASDPDWGVWCSDRRPRIEIAVSNLPGRAIEVELGLRPVASAEAPLPLLAIANGMRVGEWVFRSDEVTRIRLSIPPEIRNLADPIVLELVPGGAALRHAGQAQPFDFAVSHVTVEPDAPPAPLEAPSPHAAKSAAKPAQRSTRPSLPAAEVVSFCLAGPVLPRGVAALLGDGWFPPEPGGCWSRNEAGTLRLVGGPPTPDLRVFAVVRTVGGRHDRPAEVALELNGEPLGRWLFPDGDLRLAEIEGLAARLAEGRDAQLRFRRIGAASPSRLGLGDDTRQLGVLLVALVAVPAEDAEARAAELVAAAGFGRPRPLSVPKAELPPPEFTSGAEVFDFAGPEPEGLRLLNWWDAEADGRWSQAEDAAIFLDLPTGRSPTGLRIEMLARVFGTERQGPAQLELTIGAGPPCRLVFEGDGFVQQAASLDLAGAARHGTELCIRLRRPDAVSPAEIDPRSADDRRLGVMVRWLGVVWH